ncbi:MAG: hypothetical protein RL227_1236, partial [Pseudomonadota bacterium]
MRRFGSAANLNIHLHCLVLAGVYRRGADGSPAFIEAASSTDDELHALLQSVIERLMKLLTRRGVLVEDMGQACLAEPDADGEEARTLREDRARQPLCADIDGFSLHAAVRVEARDRKRLAQLCRYITRPSLSDDRVQLNAAGQVELKLKTQAQDAVARRHDASGAEPAGVHAAAGGTGSAVKVAPDPLGVRVTSLREVSGPPLREPWGAGTQRQAAGAGGT